MQGYVGEVYELKNSISDLNVSFKECGYTLEEDLFQEMDRHFIKHIPGGDTNKLFDQKIDRNEVKFSKIKLVKVESEEK